MPYVKINTYQDLPFCKETRHIDFYTYYDVPDIISKDQFSKDEIVRCRTIGILQSIHGKFFLTELETPVGKSDPMVRVSMIYLKCPLQSTVIPYPVQIFGTLQWKNRPVIYARILQVLQVAIALRIRDTLNSVTRLHQAINNKPDDHIDEL